jgi:hypothetical protein
MLATEGDDFAACAGVATSVVVLAGIAAADAAFCIAAGRRSDQKNIGERIDVLTQVEPGRRQAAKSLARLLDLKDTARYGVSHVSARDLRAALRASTALTKFATEIARR